jgi:colanic acid/amylovoran biosynthesis glycosyltransferase
MKKIAYVIPTFPVASETFITTEIKALQGLGHEVQGICFERSLEACQVGDEAIADAMIDIRKVRLISLISLIVIVIVKFFGSGRKGFGFAFKQQGIRPRSLLLQSLKLAYLSHTLQCEHIHAHFAQCSTATAIVAARLLGLSISFTSHGSDVYKSPSDLSLKLQNADFSVAVCKRMQNDFNNLSPSTQVYNVPCGIDTQFFNQKTVRPAVSLKQPLLYLGRISETKGILHLIQALAKLPSALRPRIDIAGDGPMRAEAEKMAGDFGIASSVNFLGSVSRHWVQQNGSHYAAMVLPFCKVKGGIMDTGPLVIKEALALKLPLLTTDIMATGEIVDSRCAFVSQSSNPEDLARTLLKLLITLNHIVLNEEDLNALRKTLGPQIDQLHVLLKHPKPSDIVDAKVEYGYQKVMTQFSSTQQGLALSKVFQQARPSA